MVRPHIASAMFVLTREALQPYIRPLDCRVLSLRAPMDSAPWCPYHNIGCHYRVRLCLAQVPTPAKLPCLLPSRSCRCAMLGNDYPPLSVVLSISSYLALPPSPRSGRLQHVVGLVVLPFGQQRIGGARHAIGQRHHRHILMSPGRDSQYPTAARVRLLARHPQHRTGAVYQ